MKMSERFLAEQKRFKDNWARVEAIQKAYPKRFFNKNDVMEEALNLLENHLSGGNEKKHGNPS